MAAATFDPALLTDRDFVRDQLGDIYTEHPLRFDPTYDFYIAEFGRDEAVVRIARGLVAEYAIQPIRTTEDGVDLDFSQRLEAWKYIIAQGQITSTSGVSSSTASGGSASVPTVARW